MGLCDFCVTIQSVALVVASIEHLVQNVMNEEMQLRESQKEYSCLLEEVTALSNEALVS